MDFNFEKWPGKEKFVGSRGHSTYVRFSRTQMYVSTKLMKADEQTNDGKFDMMVDREKRTFALKFCETGVFKLPSMPGQVSVGAFVNEFGPKIDERIVMRRDKDTGMWIGHLDGDKVDMTQEMVIKDKTVKEINE
jgi:hypothetical protein